MNVPSGRGYPAPLAAPIGLVGCSVLGSLSPHHLAVGHLTGLPPTGRGVTIRPARPTAGTGVTVRCGGRGHIVELYGAEGYSTGLRREAHVGWGQAATFDSMHIASDGPAIDVPAGETGRVYHVP